MKFANFFISYSPLICILVVLFFVCRRKNMEAFNNYSLAHYAQSYDANNSNQNHDSNYLLADWVPTSTSRIRKQYESSTTNKVGSYNQTTNNVKMMDDSSSEFQFYDVPSPPIPPKTKLLPFSPIMLNKSGYSRVNYFVTPVNKLL